MTKTNTLLLAILTLLGFSGCATQNPYAVYYRDIKGQLPPANQAVVRTPTKPPKLVQIDAFENNPQFYEKFFRMGYVPLGYSDFGGVAEPTQAQLMAQAKKVGAELVLYFSSYTHSQQGVQAVATYHPGVNLTTVEQGNASAFGTRGSAFGAYNGTTTTTSPGSVDT